LQTSAPPTTSLWPPRYFVDEVPAVRQRRLQVRRREGVVGHRQRPALLGERGDGGEVEATQQRVGRRLQHDQLRVRLERGRHLRVVGHVDERRRHAELLVQGLQDAVRAAVQVVAGDDVVAAAQQVEHTVDRRHAAGEAEAEAPAFERGEVLLQRRAGRVVRP
jgi:hypothetical protein